MGVLQKASQFLCIMGINTVVLRSGWQKIFFLFRIVVGFVIFHLNFGHLHNLCPCQIKLKNK